MFYKAELRCYDIQVNLSVNSVPIVNVVPSLEIYILTISIENYYIIKKIVHGNCGKPA